MFCLLLHMVMCDSMYSMQTGHSSCWRRSLANVSIFLVPENVIIIDKLIKRAFFSEVKLQNQSLFRPRVFQEIEAPRFQDIRYMKVLSLASRYAFIPGKYSWEDYVNEKFR